MSQPLFNETFPLDTTNDDPPLQLFQKFHALITQKRTVLVNFKKLQEIQKWVMIYE